MATKGSLPPDPVAVARGLKLPIVFSGYPDSMKGPLISNTPRSR